MLTPRELEVLDVVGEVMQERLQEVRKEYEGKLNDLQTKMAALEARPKPNLDPIWTTVLGLQERFASLPPPPEPVDLTPVAESFDALETKVAALEDRASEFARTKPDRVEVTRELSDATDRQIAALHERFAALPPPPDLTPLTEKIVALEARTPEVTLETLRAMGDDLEETIERRFAMLPPPPDLDPINVKIAAWDEQPSPATVLQMAQKAVAEGQADIIGRCEAAIEQRFAMLPPPVDLTPLAAIVDDELRKRPTSEEVLKLAQSALASTRASMLETLQVSIVDLFKALPIPEKGEPGEPGKGVTVEQFRDLFDASYAKFELESERRIMDLVQRTLDRVPIPEDGKDGLDGLGFDDLDVVQTGDRTIEFRYARGEKQKSFAFKFPWLIDRGVWKVGTAYEKGDVVTWGGSSWIVTCDNPSGKPKDGVSPDWRLMAKAGRDGKPGEPGLKGDPGKDAKPVREQPNGMMRGRSEP